MTKDQLSGTGDRALLVILTWLLTYAAGKGWISQGDAASLAPALIVVAGVVWGWYVNRPKNIVMAAANIPGTTVVTTAALSAATPEQANIVSNTENKVTSK